MVNLIVNEKDNAQCLLIINTVQHLFYKSYKYAMVDFTNVYPTITC